MSAKLSSWRVKNNFSAYQLLAMSSIVCGASGKAGNWAEKQPSVASNPSGNFRHGIASSRAGEAGAPRHPVCFARVNTPNHSEGLFRSVFYALHRLKRGRLVL